MPEVRPFRGIRYNPDRIDNLSDVAAPPYDVIDEEGRKALEARDEHNVVRLILPREEGGVDRYARARQLLDAWLANGVLVEDPEPGIYVVSQTWNDGERTHTRTGFIAAVRLEPFGEGKIYPHENTLSGPKEDRLKLIKATRANLSQVFGLFRDPRHDVDRWLAETISRDADAWATDDAGVVSRLWCEFDAGRIDALGQMVAEREVFIADGHHRYETALNYGRYLAENGGNAGPETPAGAVMMLCVAINNAGLVTYPTHRLLPRNQVDVNRLLSRLEAEFDVRPFATVSNRSEEIDAKLRNDVTPNLMVLYVGKDRPPVAVSPRDRESLLRDMSGRSDIWRSLDVSILQFGILERLLGWTLERITHDVKMGYVHTTAEAVEKIDAGEYAGAFILRATPVSAVAQVASHLEKMPPKSTYFYPKALTGLVLRRL